MLYFAYGSNLNLRHMKRHAPRAKPVGTALLAGYKLVFRHFIDLAPDETASVMGGVYDITPACERALDDYEDVPALYRKITVKVDIGGEMKEAMAYVMTDAAVTSASNARQRAPELSYFTVVAQGYRDWKLDPAALTKARLAILHPPKITKRGAAPERG